MLLTTENLARTVEVAMTRAGWRAIAASIGASEQLMFNWLSRSRKDADAHLLGASPFYAEILPHGHDYWHLHMKRSRAAFVAGYEAEVLDNIRSGYVDVVQNPATGYPLQALDPEFLGVSDEEMAEQFLNPAIDRYLWNRDADGNRTTPVYQTKVTRIAGQVTIKALSSLRPQVWGERATVDHRVQGAVVHTIAPAPFVSRQERIASGEVTDAEFTEVQSSALERPDIAELRAKAAKLLRDGPANPIPQGVVKDINGVPLNVGRKPTPPDDRPDDVPLERPDVALRDHPRSYMRPTPAPAPQRSSSAFPRHSDPTRAGSMARKVM